MTLQDYLKERYTDATVRIYQANINTYTHHQKDAQQACYADVVAYIGALRTRYPNAATLNKNLMAVKAYYAWLCFTGKRKENPAKSIRLKDKQQKDIQLQDLFSEAELEQLLERHTIRKALHYRTQVLVSLLIYQALQLCEVVQLQVADIDLVAAALYVRPTLRLHARTLQLKPRQVMLLHEYIHTIRPLLLRDKNNDLLILSERGTPMPMEDLSKHVTRIYKDWYGSREVSAKAIRQSVIANLLKKGTDLRIVQVFAGHKSAATTERYQQTNIDVLKAAVVKYHPFA